MSIVAAAATLTFAASAQAQDGKLCMDQACLGMALAEAESLKLAPADDYGFKFSGKGNYYDLGSAGKRINYAESGDLDGDLI